MQFDLYNILLLVAILDLVPAIGLMVFGKMTANPRQHLVGMLVAVSAACMALAALVVHAVQDHTASGENPMGFTTLVSEHPAPLVILAICAAVLVVGRRS